MRPPLALHLALGRSRIAPRCVPRQSFERSCESRGYSVTAVRGVCERAWSTPLAKQLARAIEMTGPVPLASYMRMCLTSDVGGYYTRATEQGRDQFGQKGDFITSPEISQIFGELIGVWFVAEWMSQGRPTSGVELIELGPGRGTLMNDVLKTISHFKDMANAIDAIYMVEASSGLRLAQRKLLCGEDRQMMESKSGYHSACKYSEIPIVWTETVRSIPQGPEKTPFIVAHEFFDTLPIHAFQVVSVLPSKTPLSSPFPASSPPTTNLTTTTGPTLQWREMVVSPTTQASTHQSLGTPSSQSHDTPVPDYQLTLSPYSTRHSLYLPESSPRYRALKSTCGAVIEICPDASLYAADFAARIGGSAQYPKQKPSGAALILDYGPGDGSVPLNSLRGISKHKRVSPFAEPGLTDLSADVDFSAIAEAALRTSDGVEVHGPVEQRTFLEGMGIRERADTLIRSAKQDGDSGQRCADIERAWKRLVDGAPNGMGTVYKALAILPENDGKRRPVGFGGDVEA